ncbi:HAD family hydrolase [Clostridium sp. HCP1S3_B4]|uniref:HAD family hydrolase n=1 Tax=unclassified Clostridium TaxID=2614128 RepID=UPI0016AB5A23|nr:HAD family hydrolase [Clostridiales bacterium]MDY2729101.1 HAD family hydrolase [Clostridium sp.]NLK24927.1 HAD family hydrolase [Clostridiales bacterium]
MYKCCIFDLDGTLLDTIKALTYTTNLTLKKYGIGPITDIETKKFVGDGYKKLMERALKFCGDTNLDNYEDSLTTYSEYFKLHCLYEVKPYEYILELLQKLKSSGIKIAVLSNKPHERTLDNIKAIFGEKYFDEVCGQKENVKKKPDPEGVFNICKSLNVKPSECLYVGDTNTDMKTGKNANIDTVGVLWGFRSRSELEMYKPKYIVSNPLEIATIAMK